jgi:hypothetical protein
MIEGFRRLERFDRSGMHRDNSEVVRLRAINGVAKAEPARYPHDLPE